MAHGVGRQFRSDARLPAIALDQLPEALPAHGLALAAEEQRLRLSLAEEPGPARPQIPQQIPGAALSVGHHPHPAGALDDQHPLSLVQVRHPKPRKLRYPQARGVQKLQHGPVPQALWGLQIRGIQEALRLLLRQHRRHPPHHLGGPQRLSGAAHQKASFFQIGKKGPDGGHAAGNGGRALSLFVKAQDIVRKLLGTHLLRRINVPFRKKGQKALQIVPVGLAGALGGAALLKQILGKLVKKFLHDLFSLHRREWRRRFLRPSFFRNGSGPAGPEGSMPPPRSPRPHPDADGSFPDPPPERSR